MMVVVMLSASVAAAEFFTVSPYANALSSVEYKNSTTKVEGATDADGNAVELTITETGLDDIKAELANIDLSSISNFKKRFTSVTGGAPVANACIVDVFDLTPSGEYSGKISITLSPKNTQPGDGVVLLHKVNGKWKVESYTNVGDDGKATFTVSSFSPFAIAKDNGRGPQGVNAPASPSTAAIQETSAVLPVLAVVASMGIAFVVASKKRVTVK